MKKKNMKSSVFKKKNISVLYVYLLSEKNEEFKKFFVTNKTEKWFDNFKKKEKLLEKKINSFFKNGWNLTKIPVIEKTIILISSYEINFLKSEKDSAFNLINKVVAFSKKYLDVDKFKYINAILDSVTREKFNL